MSGRSKCAKSYDALNSNAVVAKEIWQTIAGFKDPSTFQ